MSFAPEWVGPDEDDWYLEVFIALEEGEELDRRLVVRFLLEERLRVPMVLRRYLADMLGGNTRKRRGRPAGDPIMKLSRSFVVWRTYQLTMQEVRSRPKMLRNGTPSEIAFEETSERLAEQGIHVSPGEVRRMIYPPEPRSIPNKSQRFLKMTTGKI